MRSVATATVIAIAKADGERGAIAVTGAQGVVDVVLGALASMQAVAGHELCGAQGTVATCSAGRMRRVVIAAAAIAFACTSATAEAVTPGRVSPGAKESPGPVLTGSGDAHADATAATAGIGDSPADFIAATAEAATPGRVSSGAKESTGPALAGGGDAHADVTAATTEAAMPNRISPGAKESPRPMLKQRRPTQERRAHGPHAGGQQRATRRHCRHRRSQ